MEKIITIYNDGIIAVQLVSSGNNIQVGTINGELHGSTPEEFMNHLPVNKPFLDEVKQDPESWKMIQEMIKEGLEMRGRSIPS